MNLKIGRYHPGDKKAVLEILRLGLQDQERYAGGVVPPENAGFFEREWAEYEEGLAQEPKNWWVIRDGARVAGILWMRYPMDRLGPYATVREIAVHPEYRNKGLGTRLLNYAEKLSRSANVVMLLISGFVTNPAIRLYRRFGFQDFPERYKENKNPSYAVLWKPFRENLMEEGDERHELPENQLME